MKMLKIKKSRRNKDEWIVYNPDNFELHTHCHNLRVAISIKNNVEKYRLPLSRNPRTINSHLRLTKNKCYRDQLTKILEQIQEENVRGE